MHGWSSYKVSSLALIEATVVNKYVSLSQLEIILQQIHAQRQIGTYGTDRSVRSEKSLFHCIV